MKSNAPLRGRLLTVLGACLATMLLGLTKNTHYLGLIQMFKASHALRFQDVPTATMSTDMLCDACKRATVGVHFSCVDRIQRYVAGGSLFKEAQEIVSGEYRECSLCHVNTCQSIDNTGYRPSASNNGNQAGTSAADAENAKMNSVTSQASSLKNLTNYDLLLKESMVPFSNVTTAAYFPLSFYSGYRNQGMVFNGFVMKCIELNHSQILLSSIKWKDQFGTNKRIQHDLLFDVVHWNSFYPELPRFVTYDHTLHWQVEGNRWRINSPLVNATLPYAVAKTQKQMFIHYRRYTKLLAQNTKMQRDPVDTLMLQGAFRPHPGIQEIMDRYLERVLGVSDDTSYIALHARVEPDMQKHPVCRDKKVIKLQDIFDMLHQKFEEPPVSKVLIMLGRHLLEQEDESNEIAKENLQLLNDAIDNGLWDGRVQVFEAGSDILEKSKYHEFAPSIGGSIVNYFFAVQADLFVGTEVSSFSTDVVTTRFVRGNVKNYKYLPEGIVQTTSETTAAPPPFAC
mmetsp:Transcript_34332/g.75168  ORF Transcript_34332/g.75168 Transcript_34332/m.75168 type:complete len:511 (+) Transcript_34332:270-1802(+)